MKKTLKYKNHILLFLTVALFFGCGAKEKSDKVSTNSDRIEESVASFEDIEDKIKFIENKTDRNSDKIENIKADILKNNEKEKEDSTHSISLFFISIIINIIIILISFGLLLILFKRNQSKNRNKTNNKSYENNTVEKRINKLSDDISRLNKDLKIAFRKIESLEDKNKLAIPTAKQVEKVPSTYSKKIKHNTNSINQPTKYLSGIDREKFNTVDTYPDGSFFKIINEKDDTAEFTFHGSDEEAIAKKVFNEHISKILSGSQNTAKNVKTIKPGEIKLENNSWVITRPIEIELL